MAGNKISFQISLPCRPGAYQRELFRTRVFPLLLHPLHLVYPSEAALLLPRPLTRIVTLIAHLKKLCLETFLIHFITPIIITNQSISIVDSRLEPPLILFLQWKRKRSMENTSHEKTYFVTSFSLSLVYVHCWANPIFVSLSLDAPQSSTRDHPLLRDPLSYSRHSSGPS